MTIAHDLTELSKKTATYAAERGLEKEWQPGVETTGGNGRAVVRLPRPGATEYDLLIESGFDPEVWRIDGPVSTKKWMRHDHEWLHLYRFNATCEGETSDQRHVDVDALTQLIRKRTPIRKTKGLQPVDAWAYCASDWQIGKGERDGTAGTVQRVLDSIDQAVTRVKQLRKIGRILTTGAFLATGDLGEGTCGFYCVGTDEPVLTADLRWVPAGDLLVGDELYTVEEERATTSGRKFAPGRVTAHDVRDLPTVRIRFSDGTTLLCTSEHPVLARPVRKHGMAQWRWVKANGLMSRPHEVAKLADPWVTENSWDAGWMSGMFDGEGSFSGGKGHLGPHRLDVFQKPGPTLDRMRSVLTEHKFQLTEDVNKASGCHALRLRGGYAEVLRALGTFQPQRLISKIGYPRLQSVQNVRVINVEDAGVRPIAVMSTSSRTYIANGIVSHNSNQSYTIDCNRREQNQITRRLVTTAVDALAPMFDEFIVATTPGNHGENREGGKKISDDGDNDDVAQIEAVKEAFDRAGTMNHIRWIIPTGEMSLCVNLGGVQVGLTHGHLFRTGGKLVQAKALEWWKGQAFGLQAVSDARVLISSHFHHFSAIDHGGRTHLQTPAADPGSKWYSDYSGLDSATGVLTVRFDGSEPLGWNDLQLLGC